MATEIHNPCQFGSEPKPGAPAFFSFTEADYTAALGTWSSLASLEALGMTILPQSTAEFVMQPPPFEFPVATDYGSLAVPTLAWANGAYQRFRNLIYANKWVELAQCRNAPTTAPSSDPPPGYVWWMHGVELHVRADFQFEVGAIIGLAPRDIDGFAYRLVVATPEAGSLNIRLGHTPQVVGDGVIDNGFDDWTGGPMDEGPYPEWGVRNAFLDTDRDMYGFVAWFGAPRNPPVLDIVLDLAVRPKHIGTIPDIPPIVDPPTGFPDPPAEDDCSLADSASLCALLRTIGKKIDFIESAIQHTNAALVPPAPLPSGDPVTPEANPPNDDGSDPGVKPVTKPPKAIGAVISCTGLPDWLARHGQSPVFYPALGHVTMLTDFGPLPSQLIKHNPIVLLPLPVQMTSLAFDLTPGVRASIQWLEPPK